MLTTIHDEETVFRGLTLLVCSLFGSVLMQAVNTGGTTTVATYFTKREGMVALPIRLGMALSSVGLALYILDFTVAQYFDLFIPTWARALAVATGLSGVWLMRWTLITLGKNYSMSLHIKETQKLVDFGPYAWVRHPMYTCLLIVFFSITFVTANALASLGGLISIFSVMILRTKLEEQMMFEHFGKGYTQYCERTPYRYIPYIM
jgi:protein-S-isoprenylcysteine O-methyltransferase Ste14